MMWKRDENAVELKRSIIFSRCRCC